MSRTLKWLILLAGLNVANFWYTANPYYTKVAVFMNLCALFLFWVARKEAGGRRFAVLQWVIIGASVLVSVETILQIHLGHGLLVRHSMSPIGTIGNSNYLGAYLLFGIFAALGVQKGWVVLPVILYALFLSRARASWLGFAVGFAVWCYWRMPNKALFMTFTLIAAAFFAMLWIGYPHRLNNWTETTTLKYRWKYFKASTELWLQSPLWGTGMWSYRNMVYEAQAKIGERDPSYWEGYTDPKPRRVHNDYLESLNDGGMIYFAAFWGFILRTLEKSRRRLSGAWCGQVAVMVAACFFFPFRVPDTLALFFVQAGALCSERA